MSHLTMTEEQHTAYLVRRAALARKPPPHWVIELGWPPNVNNYVRHSSAGAHYMTSEARHYRADVLVRCHKAGIYNLKLADRLAVVMHATPPDRRRRDLDNHFKAILDGMTHAGVWLDDSQIDDLRMLRYMGRPGTVNVFVSVIGGNSGATD